MRPLRAVDHPLTIQVRVVRALMLRDIRTRFFGNGLGYLIAIAWPLVHMGILLVIYAFSGRAVPYGNSLLVFFSTALVPTLSFIYMSRFVMQAATTNKPLVYFPVVKVVDLFIARGLLEVLASCCMTIIVMSVLYCADLDVVPISSVDALGAMCATMLLGLGVGVLNGMIALAVPMWATAYSLFTIILYLTSGVLFLPSALPSSIAYFLSWNPLLHGVEWMRLSYFQGYESVVLDKSYLLTCGVGSLLVGLLVERFARGWLLAG